MITLEAVSELGDRVVVEDDGRVCYAYLFVGDRCVGDVWLYNSVEISKVPEWTLPDAGDRLPFVNPLGFTEAFTPIEDASEVEVFWGESEGRLQAAVHLRGRYHALLQEGEKPGWCRLAEKNGPLAKVLKLSV